MIFLSTPSARRATVRTDQTYQQGIISIHALREEGDRRTTYSEHRLDDFYPRPPRGGRRYGFEALPLFCLFLSTPSARRATQHELPKSNGRHISIHALREEGDHRLDGTRRSRDISIHALREEGDSKNRDKISIFKQIIQHSARI